MKKNQKWCTLLCRLSMPRKLLMVMRISFILLFTVLLQVSATGLAQKVVIKQNKLTYEQLFEEIEVQTGIATLLSNREINLNDQINVQDENYELEDLLKAVTKGTDLTYELIDDYIIIRPLNESEKVVVKDNVQQPEKKIIITGTIKDEEGLPLPFAAVCFKGTTSGCISAVDGSYSLEAPDEEGLVLEISSLGFVTQEIPVEGRTVINVVMVEDMMGLDEVVVT
ncbi:MAG: carboxypeptidase-like regulatory domain-containing protein, partial [Bacteroidales bacterium]|nr:carboxypeptidase-like regulatory domain-containing protein [Bacteroidales bacterium]